MNYKETVDFLYEQLPVYQKYGASAIKKDLDNIRILSSLMGDPHKSYLTIHVGGTNGKGTVSHLLAAVFQQAGYRVGLYTSPHYTDFRERIKVNGNWIGETDVVDFVTKYKRDIEHIIPSFFEITVAMAFEYFALKKVDIAIIEVGLGGRLDSTNIIHPEISVITHISLDHMDMLGPDEYTIAHEKAGIIKAGVPVIIGRYQAICDSVFINKARSVSSSITFASLEWKVINNLIVHVKSGYTVELSESLLATSPFIAENIITALEAIRVWNNSGNKIINKDCLVSGINHFKGLSNYIGRWQIVNERPLAVADSAHNIDALSKIAKKLKAMNYERLHVVIGFVKGKDIYELLGLFPKDALYYFVAPDIFRAVDVEILAATGSSLGFAGISYDSVLKGYTSALSNATDNDLVYIGGSSFVVGDLLKDLNMNKGA